MGRIYINPSHVQMLMHPKSLAECIERSVEMVARIRKSERVDAIAVRGISGAAVGFAVAAQLKLPVVLVRKFGDDSHANPARAEMVEGMGYIPIADNKLRYVIVDDFIENGNTLNAIVGAIATKCAEASEKELFSAECVGCVLYSDWILSAETSGHGPVWFQTLSGHRVPVYPTKPVEERFQN